MLTVQSLSAGSLALLCAAPAFAQSGVVSDDFNTPTVDPIWRYVDPQSDTISSIEGFATTDARLKIEVPGGQSHNLWRNQNFAPRLLQSANNTDFELEVRFESEVQERFQFQGIIVQESFNHFLRFEAYHDGSSVQLFAARVNDPSSASSLYLASAATTPGWLRVKRTGDDWTFSTSTDGVNFDEAVQFTYVLGVTEVGIHAGNHDAAGSNTSPAFVALADYFENRDAPLVSEDGPMDTEPPVADAGLSVSAHVGETVQLDGSASSDDVTRPEDLVYSWQLIEQPAGSAAALSGADTATPSLTLDAVGDYVAELLVTDEVGLQSERAQVTVSSLNQPPVADAGGDVVVLLGGTALLDGFGSSDPDNDALGYAWQILSAPPGSVAALVGADTAAPSLTPDVEGDYTIELVVTDSFAFSAPATVTVSGLDAIQAAVMDVRDAAAIIRSSSFSSFRRWYFRLILRWHLRVAACELRYGYVSSARCRLRAVLRRLDGCAERGSVDSWSSGYRLDWVKRCSVQNEVYPLISGALAAIE
ncbi:MAG: DUF1349 domain-containing protein [Planctomycetota bacterium]